MKDTDQNLLNNTLQGYDESLPISAAQKLLNNSNIETTSSSLARDLPPRPKPVRKINLDPSTINSAMIIDKDEPPSKPTANILTERVTTMQKNTPKDITTDIAEDVLQRHIELINIDKKLSNENMQQQALKQAAISRYDEDEMELLAKLASSAIENEQFDDIAITKEPSPYQNMKYAPYIDTDPPSKKRDIKAPKQEPDTPFDQPTFDEILPSKRQRAPILDEQNFNQQTKRLGLNIDPVSDLDSLHQTKPIPILENQPQKEPLAKKPTKEPEEYVTPKRTISLDPAERLKRKQALLGELDKEQLAEKPAQRKLDTQSETDIQTQLENQYNIKLQPREQTIKTPPGPVPLELDQEGLSVKSKASQTTTNRPATRKRRGSSRKTAYARIGLLLVIICILGLFTYLISQLIQNQEEADPIGATSPNDEVQMVYAHQLEAVTAERDALRAQVIDLQNQIELLEEGATQNQSDQSPNIWTNEPNNLTARPADGGSFTYIVVSGDNLTILSNRFFGNPNHIQEIRDANNLTNDTLFLGQQLTIPAIQQ